MKLFAKSLLALFLFNSMVSLIESVINCDVACGQANPHFSRYVDPSANPNDGNNCAKYHVLMKCIDEECDPVEKELQKMPYANFTDCPDHRALCDGCDGWPVKLNVSGLNKAGCGLVLKKLECLKKRKCNDTDLVPPAKEDELKKCSEQPDPPAQPTEHPACSVCPGFNIRQKSDKFNVSDIESGTGLFTRKGCGHFLKNLKCLKEHNCTIDVPNGTEEALEKCSNAPMPTSTPSGNTTNGSSPMTAANGLLFLLLANAWIALLTKIL